MNISSPSHFPSDDPDAQIHTVRTADMGGETSMSRDIQCFHTLRMARALSGTPRFQPHRRGVLYVRLQLQREQYRHLFHLYAFGALQ